VTDRDLFEVFDKARGHCVDGSSEVIEGVNGRCVDGCGEMQIFIVPVSIYSAGWLI